MGGPNDRALRERARSWLRKHAKDCDYPKPELNKKQASTGCKEVTIALTVVEQIYGVPVPAGTSAQPGPHATFGFQNAGSTCHIGVVLCMLEAGRDLRRAVFSDIRRPALDKNLQRRLRVQELLQEALVSVKTAPPSKEFMRELQQVLVSHALIENKHQDSGETLDALLAEVGYSLPLAWVHRGSAGSTYTVIQDADPREYNSSSDAGLHALRIHLSVGQKMAQLIAAALAEDVLEKLTVAVDGEVRNYTHGARGLVLVGRGPTSLPVLVNRFRHRPGMAPELFTEAIEGALEEIDVPLRSQTGAILHVKMRLRGFAVHTGVLDGMVALDDGSATNSIVGEVEMVSVSIYQHI